MGAVILYNMYYYFYVSYSFFFLFLLSDMLFEYFICIVIFFLLFRHSYLAFHLEQKQNREGKVHLLQFVFFSLIYKQIHIYTCYVYISSSFSCRFYLQKIASRLAEGSFDLDIQSYKVFFSLIPVLHEKKKVFNFILFKTI